MHWKAATGHFPPWILFPPGGWEPGPEEGACGMNTSLASASQGVGLPAREPSLRPGKNLVGSGLRLKL